MLSRSDLLFGAIFFFSLIFTLIMVFVLWRPKPKDIVKRKHDFQEIHQPEIILSEKDYEALCEISDELRLAGFEFLNDFMKSSKDFIRVMQNRAFGIYAELTLREGKHDYSNLSFLTFLTDESVEITSHLKEEDFERLDKFEKYRYEYVAEDVKVAQMFSKHMHKLIDLKKDHISTNDSSKQDYINRRLIM